MTDSEGADVLIGIVAPVNTNDVLHQGTIAMEQLARTMPSLKCVIAFPRADEEIGPRHLINGVKDHSVSPYNFGDANLPRHGSQLRLQGT